MRPPDRPSRPPLTPRQKPRPRQPREQRRWCIPPAILRESDETLEGSHVLEEVPGDTGLQLWVALRSVTLWADTEPERRGELFGGGAAGRRLERLAEAAVEPELSVPLTTLAALLNDPTATPATVVSLMCVRISEWAEAEGAPGTAVVFAQAAALASPQDSAASRRVGRLALAWGRLARAETWLRRTVGIARRGRDPESYAGAYTDLGTLLDRRGAPKLARRHYLKGLRAARRYGLPRERARALHGLFRQALDAGEWDEAERLGRTALRARARREPEPALLRDLAGLWLLRGDAARAASALRRVADRATDAAERAPALALLARAAAETGDARLYETAWSEAWRLATAAAPGDHARALLDLGRAAEARADWLRVDQATRALRELTGDPDAQRFAAELDLAAADRPRRRA
jgi:hypothetical protein